MKIITIVDDMQVWAKAARRNEQHIAFVPTMGFLHEGHLSLLRKGRRVADQLVLSIFVNPTQFGPHEDFDRYPQDLEGDLAKARSCNVDVVFVPTRDAMYQTNFQTSVNVCKLSQGLCGKSRPGHFQGVATVVLKLFLVVQPDIAIFGEKDYQQLQVIRQMTRDLHLPIDIRGMPIVREPDGLAMSSRNTLLTPEDRSVARALFQSLTQAQKMVHQGETNLAVLTDAVRAHLLESRRITIDYVSLCQPETLTPLTELVFPALLAIAVRVGNVRLIDNCILKKNQ